MCIEIVELRHLVHGGAPQARLIGSWRLGDPGRTRRSTSAFPDVRQAAHGHGDVDMGMAATQGAMAEGELVLAPPRSNAMRRSAGMSRMLVSVMWAWNEMTMRLRLQETKTPPTPPGPRDHGPPHLGAPGARAEKLL
ncbi:predicted protein [Verticillium alfalfae VaMs.102]|uniref:Predicted protein n=1 Tax=Verticillium alfalfae (strain VaMs.102 / ATCC MYA-4576 / FGSC 10136) TaxID=526221 RepID=C9SBC5_VERA1|nr:predicted protein [Verticillium alfalfae VaMs.102]EEY15659.1 predicted protein [Verticillium alfalfae VaMs.102]